MWVSGFLGYLVESLKYALQVAQGDFVAPVAHPERFGSLELLLDQIIYLATTFLLVFSILMLSRKTNRRGKWGVILFVVAGMTMMELAGRTGFDAILPDRWLPFIFIGTAILFAFSLIHVSERAGNLGRSALVALVAVMCISMILSPTANVDSPVVNSAFRYGFQLSETKGSDFALGASTGQIMTDFQLGSYFTYGLRVDVAAYGPSFFDGSKVDPSGLMLTRNYCLDHYFLVDLGTSNKTVGYSSARLIEGSAFNRTVIYETAVVYSTPTLTIHTI